MSPSPPKVQQHQSIYHADTGNSFRILPGPLPWFVARDVMDAVDHNWRGTATFSAIPAKWVKRVPLKLMRAGRSFTARPVMIALPGLVKFFAGHKGGTADLDHGKLVTWLTETIVPQLHGAAPEPDANVVTLEQAPAVGEQVTLRGTYHDKASSSTGLVTRSGDDGSMVLVSSTGDMVVSTLTIAEGTGLQHKNVMELVQAKLGDLNRFGIVAFETRLNPQGSPTKYGLLNERQTTLLFTHMRSSPTVDSFKLRLVETFYKMQDQLKSTALATTPKVSFPAYALNQVKTNANLLEGQRLLSEQISALTQAHEDLEQRVADMAALLEGH